MCHIKLLQRHSIIQPGQWCITAVNELRPASKGVFSRVDAPSAETTRTETNTLRSESSSRASCDALRVCLLVAIDGEVSEEGMANSVEGSAEEGNVIVVGGG